MISINKFRIILLCTILNISITVLAQEIPPYRDTSFSTEIRVKDLLNRMDRDEKFWQLYMIPGDLSIGEDKLKNGIFGLQIDAGGEAEGVAGQMLKYYVKNSASDYIRKVNSLQHFLINETRLGIPAIPFTEALHGLVLPGATAFPQSIALAATFDTMLMHKVAAAIAEEAQIRGIRQVLGPVINIASDVRWGRVEETYGEDPFLTSVMGYSYIIEFEKRGIITTPKHFVVNSGDGGRDSYPIHINDRLMEEIYYPPFKTAIVAGARSLMTAYNSFDGTPCSASDHLLNQKLKKEWNFRGFVISDACAVGGANVLHFTSSGYTEATEKSLNGGLDVIFQTDYNHFKLFKEAFDRNLIPSAVIDSSVARILRAKFEIGLFEHPYADTNDVRIRNEMENHKTLALQAARESVVLLKNHENFLPLGNKIKKIAVIGYDATEARLGGYSGPGNNKISILDGITKKCGKKTEVLYAQGCGRKDFKFNAIPTGNLFCTKDGEKVNGLSAEYYNNITFSGVPVVKRIDNEVNFAWTLYPPDTLLDNGWYSVKWTGKLVGPETGIYQIGIEGNDGYSLFVDGKKLIDVNENCSFSRKIVSYEFEKGKEYDLEINFHESAGPARLKLIWNADITDSSDVKINEAVRITEGSDIAIVVAGINEGEFNDRASLKLPGRQVEMINRIAATGKPVIVVLIGGSAITMSDWIDNVKYVLLAWYPGEAGGEAIADILFGDYNPAGRLPVTFPVSEGQLPLVYNHKPTGRGDDYTDLTGMPLFPFGFGLSYTTFEYSDLVFTNDTIKPGEETIIRFKVKNTGKYAGDEVCQLYIHDELSSVSSPVKELKGFQRVHFEPGEEKKLSFRISPESLMMLDKDLHRVTEPGWFTIKAGSSSQDLRLRGRLLVRQ